MPTENLALNVDRRWNWDKIGIGLSSLCVLHCILTPVLFLLLPAFGFLAGEHTHEFHWFMALLLLPVALIAFIRGYLHHREISVVLIGVSGIALIFAALLIHEDYLSLAAHTAVNLTGSVILLTGHVLNRRYCKRCEHHHH